jgi:hypothetical protein
VHYQIGAMGRPRQIEKALQVDSEVKHQLTGYLMKIMYIPHLHVFIYTFIQLLRYEIPNPRSLLV